MSWTKLDDGFWMHPKVVHAGNEAAGIFARCLSYCGAYTTDGLVPEAVALTIAGSRQKLEMVVNTGLVERTGSGAVYIRDYLHHNPTREEIEQRREQRRDAGRRGGLAKAARNGGHRA